jgi:hypothetical protein
VTDANGCSNQSSAIIVTNVSIASVQQGSQFTLYPNPNKGVFTISGAVRSNDNKVAIQITDATGKVLSTEEATVINGKLNIEIRMSDYAAGLYMVKLVADQYNTVIPFRKD